MATTKKTIEEATAAQLTRLAALKELSQQRMAAEKAYNDAVSTGNTQRADKIKAMIGRIAAQKIRLGENTIFEDDEQLADLTKIKTSTLQELHALHRYYAEKDELHDPEVVKRLKQSVNRATAELARRGVVVPGIEESVENNLEEAYDDGYSDMSKPYGVRWTAFTGREQRQVRKQKFFKTKKQMDTFVDKLVFTDGFYEIDSWCFPKDEPVSEAEVRAISPNEGTDSDDANTQLDELSPAAKMRYVTKAAYNQDRNGLAAKYATDPEEKTKATRVVNNRIKGIARALDPTEREVAEDADNNQYALVDMTDDSRIYFIGTKSKINAHASAYPNKFLDCVMKPVSSLNDQDVNDFLGEDSEQIDEISDAAAKRLLMARIQQSGDEEGDIKKANAMMAVGKRAERKYGKRPDPDATSVLRDRMAQNVWQDQKAKNRDLVNQQFEDASCGGTSSGSVATGAVSTKKRRKDSIFAEDAITELDNGPKGRVNTDKVNYDARRNSTGGIPKDELEQRKAAASVEKANNAILRRNGSRAQERQWRLEDAREEPLVYGDTLPFETVKKLAAQYAGANDIVDVISRRNYRIRLDDGSIVAACELAVYVAYDLNDFGYDEETIAQAGGDQTSDVVYLRFARDPQRPSKIVFRGFGA